MSWCSILLWNARVLLGGRIQSTEGEIQDGIPVIIYCYWEGGFSLRKVGYKTVYR